MIAEIKKELEKIKNKDELGSLWRKYLGSKGKIKLMLKEIGSLAKEKRKERALEAQALKKQAEDLFLAVEKKLNKETGDKFLKDQAQRLDFSRPKIGHLHPITQTVRELNDFFEKMGYSVMDGPEIETDQYCFERMNVPRDHPARNMQDTIYIKEPDYLLRTQTSSIEARLLENYKPPFKVVAPGKSYRNEKVNPSNHFVLHQYQGVVVMRRVSLKDLFGTFSALFRKMYGPRAKVRYRNKYYPEVEPGAGLDMQCFNCKGKGCRICKGIGWIEMGGSGIIHPRVLKDGGINPEKWMGFAFGLGLDRWVMARYGIKDIRTLLGGALGYKPFSGENILN
ncbi:MAG: phenylalanine--tRNA ligase subunit alpha [Patescibacteria group bacterium]|nr:phenylalanine--tRNA ligase subunit alpha [Patescibacteria group bacterium]